MTMATAAPKLSLLQEGVDLQSLIPEFNRNVPFRNIVIDNFLREDVAEAVAGEFPPFAGPAWAVYNNAI